MKIFYVTFKNDYNTRTWQRTGRVSGVYDTTYLPLAKIGEQRGHTIRPFWVDEEITERGEAEMNDALRDAILKEKPDVCLFDSGIEENFDKNILAEIKEKSLTDTVYIGGDDSWEFDLRSKHYACYFQWIVTCYSGAVERYRALGYKKIVSWQGGVNLGTFKPVNAVRDIDVSFVGTWGPPRGKTINALKKAGINVVVRGNGWPEGGVSFEEMVNILSRSKISLCLNPPAFYFSWRSIARLFFRRRRLGEEGSLYNIDVWNFADNFRTWWQKRIRNIKGRVFEIPAMKAMQLTMHADNLEDYFVPGKEIIFYKDDNDLIEKIRYYLAHDAEREAIARAGYERTVRDHSREKRLFDLFAAIGHPL